MQISSISVDSCVADDLASIMENTVVVAVLGDGVSYSQDLEDQGRETTN